MTYLVTGATGHIGNTLIRTLLENNPEQKIRALVLPDDEAIALDGLSVEIVPGNILEPATLDAAMEGVDVVFHLAAIITIRNTNTDLVERVNIQGAVNVGEAAIRNGVKRMVHVASIHIFERVPTGVLDESIPLVTKENAIGIYDYTKAEAVRRLRGLINQGLDVVFGCPTGVFGPNDYLGSEYGKVIRGYLNDSVQYVLDGGYNWVDVRDVASSLIKLAEKGQTGELYLLSGEYCNMRDFLGHVGTILDREYTIRKVPYGVAWTMAHLMAVAERIFNFKPSLTPYSLRTIRDNVNFSHQKAKDAIGHHPRPIQDTLRDALQWYQEHPLS